MHDLMENAIESSTRISSLLKAIELITVGIEVKKEDHPDAEKADNLLYLAEEIAEDLERTLDRLCKEACKK